MQKRADAVRKYDSSECAVPGCTKRRYARGWCSAHYRRWKLYGDPMKLGPKRTGMRNTNWKGDDIGYDAAHIRARSHVPLACQACGSTDGRLEIALRKDASAQHVRTNPRDGSPYSVRVDDYVRLCVRCHRRYDSPRAETRAEIISALGPLPRN